MGQNAIDLEHLARYTGGERGLNSEVLRLFDDQITKMVAELHTVLASRDAKRWRELAHSIKGAARGVGAFSMGDLAASAEPISPSRRTGGERRDRQIGARGPNRARLYRSLSGCLKIHLHAHIRAALSPTIPCI